jgi:PPK2 family polyphosphate:nucleotide phosphotransferase
MSHRALTLPPGEAFRLADVDPRDTGGLEHKKKAKELLKRNRDRLECLQERLYAERGRALLVVLQGMDTGGKDGVIRHVMSAFSPQGVVVTSFKVPTEEELAHDFLWRIHRAAPRTGMIGIFNRSHYEDVVVVRVRELVPEPVWAARYQAINEFERLLAENRVTVVKLFLHISPDEQAERLEARRADPEKRWKFSPGDLAERARWPAYMAAWDDALTRCNTAHAPWYVVPADHKWYRNLVASEVLLDVLERLGPTFPAPPDDIESCEIPPIIWP